MLAVSFYSHSLASKCRWIIIERVASTELLTVQGMVVTVELQFGWHSTYHPDSWWQ